MEKALQFCLFIIICLILLVSIKSLEVQQDNNRLNKDTNDKISVLTTKLEWLDIVNTIEVE